MRTVITVVAVAAISLVLLFGLKWLGVITQDAMVVGFVTGLVIAIMLSLTNRKKGSTG